MSHGINANLQLDPNVPLDQRGREYYHLSHKQWAFVLAYTGEHLFNGGEAIRATYGADKPYEMDDNTVKQMAYQNLRKPNIKRAIEDRLEQYAMKSEEVLARISKVARADVSDLFDINDKGEPILNLEKAKKNGSVSLIKKINFNSFGTVRSIELRDADSALHLLGKHHRLFDRSAERPQDARQEARALLSELRSQYQDIDPHILVDKVVKRFSGQGVTASDIADVIQQPLANDLSN